MSFERAVALANLAILIVLVGTTIYYARQTKRTVEELRDARVADSLPVLHWQEAQRTTAAQLSKQTNDRLRASVQVWLTNVGAGPARLTFLEVSTVEEPNEPRLRNTVSIPSTMHQRERVLFILRRELPASSFPQRRTIRVRLRYTDLDRLRSYETTPVFVVSWSPEKSFVETLDTDERSPAQRRVGD